MLKIGICDSDSHSVQHISKLIDSATISIGFDAEITLATTNPNEIYTNIENGELDILFIDTNLNDNLNGIDFALELRKLNKKFKLIFITNHFEYALLAYSCKTFGYILKPLDNLKALEIMTRLQEDLGSSRTRFIKLNKDYTIRTKDIFFIERNKCKTTIYTKDGIYTTCLSLNEIMEHLPDSFIRNHRSFIVNQDTIFKIDKDEKIIFFDNGLTCPLGQALHLI